MEQLKDIQDYHYKILLLLELEVVIWQLNLFMKLLEAIKMLKIIVNKEN